MAARLADRLAVARGHLFVGRTDELSRFRSALAEAELPFHVLYVFGPGGVGKTALLQEFAHLCRQAGVPCAHVDARNVDPTPEDLLDALSLALQLSPAESPLDHLAARSARSAILIDTYEVLTPLDEWVRTIFLPQLPEEALTVLAGRQPPSPAWRADLAWNTLIRPMPLRNLGPEESRDYLERREVPADQHLAVWNFTHGHPLALSLAADYLEQRPGLRFEPQSAPDMVKALLEQFVQKLPGPAHRAALEASALVRAMTEDLLGVALAAPEFHELFEWLRGLSFVESGASGVFLHDLAREALAADLRWRNPAWYAELHRRLRTHYSSLLQSGALPSSAQQRILFDYIFLHRDNPVVRPFFDWQASPGLLVEAARPEHLAALLAMVEQHEGDASARIAAHWLARQPQGMMALLNPASPPHAESACAGFLAMLALDTTTPSDREADPAVMAAWDYMQQHSPLRPGERATLFRFWMAREGYQSVSPEQSAIFVSIVRHYLNEPRLAFTMLPCADPDFWAPVFAYADLQRLPQADFAVGGRRFGVYGHDWRATPPAVWLAKLAEREIGAAPQADSPPPAEPLIVLSQSAFESAVRDALRDLAAGSGDAFRSNPLIRSRLVVERAGIGSGGRSRAEVLRALIREAIESLSASPREQKLYRVLLQTYLHPAPTQERAAEMLDLPFATYRRHLKAGVTRMTQILWQWELAGPEK